MGKHDAIGGLSGAFGTSGSTLPLEWVDGTLTRYHRGGNAIAKLCGPSGTFLSPPRAIREHGGGMSQSAAARLLGWVDGTLARFLWGVNAISFPSPRHVL
jgi:hypothetical protein